LTLHRRSAKGKPSRIPFRGASRRGPLKINSLFSFHWRLGLSAACAALAVDQAHKYWMLNFFDIQSREPIRLLPFLDVVMSWNHGISYSLFSTKDDIARIALLSAQLAIICGLSVWLCLARQRITSLGLGLIIGGALGNATDRLLRGAVADFFFLHTTLPVGPLANYVFNLADVAITLGVALLLFESFIVPPPADVSTT
jgi:signal peptidase II